MFFFVSFFCNIEYKFRFVLCHGLFTRCNAYVLTYLLHGAEIHPNIIHLSKPRSHQWSLSLRLPHQDPIHPLCSPISATCPAHLILLDFIIRTILGEEYKSFSSSLCNLLHSSVTSSLLGPNILLNTIFSDTLSFLFSRNVSD